MCLRCSHVIVLLNLLSGFCCRFSVYGCVVFFFVLFSFFFFKQKTAYEMRISDWSSDVCSSDLAGAPLCPIEDHGQMSQSRWTTTARMRATRGNKRPNQMYIP